MSLSIVTAAVTEPVSLAEVKRWCKVEQDMRADDAVLTALITAARQSIDGPDGWLGRAIMKQTLDLKLDGFPAWTLDVPLPPLISVSSITYVATDGTSTTLSSSLYTVDTASEPGRITPAYAQSWPATRDQMAAVTVRFICGYATANAVPQTIKTALKELIRYYYARPDAPATGVPPHVAQLLASYRVHAGTVAA